MPKLARSVVLDTTGVLMLAVPRLPLVAAEAIGAAAATMRVSEIDTPILAAALRVGRIMKLSPTVEVAAGVMLRPILAAVTEAPSEIRVRE